MRANSGSGFRERESGVREGWDGKGTQIDPGDLPSVGQQQGLRPEAAGIRKEEAVFHQNAGFIDGNADVLVVELDLLHLGRGAAVAAVDDAVAAEAVVRGALAVVAAVGEVPLTVAVFLPDGLVDIVPDEAALVVHLTLGEIGVLVHGAAGVAHGMGVLAADQGLLGVRREEGFDLGGGSIHPALEVAGVRIAGIPGDALIVYRAMGIEAVEEAAHLSDDASAVGFVAAGPENDAGVVLVALVHGAHAVKEQGCKLLVVLRHDEFGARLAAQKRIPAAVGLHVVLVHDVDPVTVAELVQSALIGIVRGADGVDVVALHGEDIQKQFLPVRYPAAD